MGWWHMDNLVQPREGVEAAGLRVTVDKTIRAASLRYFDANGPFVASACAALGIEWPGPLKATVTPGSSRGSSCVLAWRSPTETIALTTDPVRLSALESAVAGSQDGCVVDQTGGIRVLRASGERLVDLITRLGSTASLPGHGEARRSRMADIPVLAVCIDPLETWLLVERVYLDHLLGWMQVTAADFPRS